jgi:hypothetical protein
MPVCSIDSLFSGIVSMDLASSSGTLLVGDVGSSETERPRSVGGTESSEDTARSLSSFISSRGRHTGNNSNKETETKEKEITTTITLITADSILHSKYNNGNA